MLYIFNPFLAYFITMIATATYGEFVEINKNMFDEYLVILQVSYFIIIMRSIRRKFLTNTED